ncbi:hypothetical protein CORC01_12010 [Colletotrichum orchidophilum]|uniref:Uncharacterized protein n=1 Tax=Colletotrichum orchidophilum TaxID=1209926 RepID=A0A1G4AUA9_9PEZI|nr:uncharacterized protein CORC01_12010 [Colletotrichum orchidophilum]OHE92676.1 hypothetical protein CORC01_12010 [Colletotrichum orchidophilum]
MNTKGQDSELVLNSLADCYVLVEQKLPSLSPGDIATHLQSSATFLKQYNGIGILTTIAQQGSGLFNVLRAITSETDFSATELNLRDSAGPIEHVFTNENLSSASKTYKLGHRPAEDVNGLPNGNSGDMKICVPALPFISSSAAGVRNNDKIVFTFPAKQVTEKQTKTPDNDPVLTILIDQPSTYVGFVAIPAHFASNAAYNFAPSIFGSIPCIQPNTTSFFTVTTPPLDLNSFDNVAGLKIYGLVGLLWGGDVSHGNVATNFRGYGVYSTERTWGVVELANGTIYQLPNTDYRILFRALTRGGNLNSSSDYDSWLSPIIGVNITNPGHSKPWPT